MNISEESLSRLEKQAARTKKNESEAKSSGLVKIHPLVPAANVKEILEYCAKIRNDFKNNSGMWEK